MTAHWGSWEIAGQAIGLYRGPLDVVARPMDNPHLEAHSVRIRGRFGNRIIPKAGAARRIRAALREGGRVGILDANLNHEHALKDAVRGHEATANVTTLDFGDAHPLSHDFLFLRSPIAVRSWGLTALPPFSG